MNFEFCLFSLLPSIPNQYQPLIQFTKTMIYGLIFTVPNPTVNIFGIRGRPTPTARDWKRLEHPYRDASRRLRTLAAAPRAHHHRFLASPCVRASGRGRPTPQVLAAGCHTTAARPLAEHILLKRAH